MKAPYIALLGHSNFSSNDQKCCKSRKWRSGYSLAKKDMRSADLLTGVKCLREPKIIDWVLEAAEKGGYPHFMLKEIHYEPSTLRNTIRLQEEYMDLMATFVQCERAASCGLWYFISCMSCSFLHVFQDGISADTSCFCIGVCFTDWKNG